MRHSRRKRAAGQCDRLPDSGHVLARLGKLQADGGWSWAFFSRQEMGRTGCAKTGSLTECLCPPLHPLPSTLRASAIMTLPPPRHLSCTVQMHSQAAVCVSCFHPSLYPLSVCSFPCRWASLCSRVATHLYEGRLGHLIYGHSTGTPDWFLSCMKISGRGVRKVFPCFLRKRVYYL